MNYITVLIMSALPKLLMGALSAIAGKLFTEDFVQKILTEIIIFGLQKLVKLTNNVIDDSIVAEIVAKLEEKPK